MRREILLGHGNDLAHGDPEDLATTLGLERLLDGLDRPLSRQDPDRHAHACADLGLLYSMVTLNHCFSFLPQWTWLGLEPACDVAACRLAVERQSYHDNDRSLPTNTPRAVLYLFASALMRRSAAERCLFAPPRTVARGGSRWPTPGPQKSLRLDRAAVFIPASCSFRIAMICSSVCRFPCIVWSFPRARLQFALDQFKGATSCVLDEHREPPESESRFAFCDLHLRTCFFKGGWSLRLIASVTGTE
jgi:hypothetical protein